MSLFYFLFAFDFVKIVIVEVGLNGYMVMLSVPTYIYLPPPGTGRLAKVKLI